jgi:hypothetical protein
MEMGGGAQVYNDSDSEMLPLKSLSGSKSIRRQKRKSSCKRKPLKTTMGGGKKRRWAPASKKKRTKRSTKSKERDQISVE